ncbi:hypothetical protein DFH27DRAFT_616451 [Peziza echinospora]|nr:hypothetical protein DFH27DRAFT_616451 [Peziza echinospora]
MPAEENSPVRPPSQSSAMNESLHHIQRTVSKTSSIQNLRHKLSTASLFRRNVTPPQAQGAMAEESHDSTNGAVPPRCGCLSPCVCDALAIDLEKVALNPPQALSEVVESPTTESFARSVENGLSESLRQKNKTAEAGKRATPASSVRSTRTEATARSSRPKSVIYDEASLPPGHYLHTLAKREASLARSAAASGAPTFASSQRPMSLNFPTRPPSVNSISTISTTLPHDASELYAPRGHRGSPANTPRLKPTYIRTTSTSSFLTGSTLSLGSHRSSGSVQSPPGTPGGSESGSSSTFARDYVSFPEFRSNSERNSPTLGDIGNWVGGMGRKLSRKLIGKEIDPEMAEEPASPPKSKVTTPKVKKDRRRPENYDVDYAALVEAAQKKDRDFVPK